MELIESYQERRDCADQKILLFLEACGYVPIPVPNVVSELDIFMEAIKPTGVLLTGGNSLAKVWRGCARAGCNGISTDQGSDDKRNPDLWVLQRDAGRLGLFWL